MTRRQTPRIYVRKPELRKGTVKSSRAGCTTMIVLDFDTDGCLFGVEVVDAARLLPPELLESIDSE